MLAGFGAEMIDGAGNLLFLRAVHPYERSEMTTVFVSYRDVAQLGAGIVNLTSCSRILGRSMEHDAFMLPCGRTSPGSKP